jgi:ABC-type branched-subunit amino acid transport system permease subunit
LLALLGAGLVTVPLGALVAIPAIRLSGIYLAIATFGFGILLERLVYPTRLLFGQAGAVAAPRPHVLGLDGDRGYYYAVLAVVAAMVLLAMFVIRGRLGRLLRAMSDSPVALSTLGTGVNSIRVLVFCVSAFMAGVAGALFAGLTQSVNGAGFSFFASLTWLTILVISGAPFGYRPLPTALLGGVNIAVIPAYLTNAKLLALLPAVFGVAAVANALLSDRGRSAPGGQQPGMGAALVAGARRPVSGPSPVTARLLEAKVAAPR